MESSSLLLLLYQQIIMIERRCNAVACYAIVRSSHGWDFSIIFAVILLLNRGECNRGLLK